MASSVKNSKRTAVLAAILIASPIGASFAAEPLNRLGRFFGCGYSDGYHACTDSGCRLREDLPPKGYAEKCNSESCLGKVRGNLGGHGSNRSFYDRVDARSSCDGTQCDAVGCDGQCATMGVGCDSPGCDTAGYVVGYQQQPVQTMHVQSVPSSAFHATQSLPAMPNYILPAEKPQPYDPQPYSINQPSPARDISPAQPQTKAAEAAQKPASQETDPRRPVRLPSADSNTHDAPKVDPKRPIKPSLGEPKKPEVAPKVKIGPYDVNIPSKTQAKLASDMVEAQKRPIRPLPAVQKRQIRIAAAPRQDITIQPPKYAIPPSRYTSQPSQYAPGSVGTVAVPPPLPKREYIGYPVDSRSSVADSRKTATQQITKTPTKSPYAGEPYDVEAKKSILPTIPSWRFIKQP